MLAPDVVVREAAWAPAGFDARRCALSRLYRYYLLCSEWPDPLHRRHHLARGPALELRRMEAACESLLGEHDFSSFCHAGPAASPASLVRRVLRAGWSELGGAAVLRDRGVLVLPPDGPFHRRQLVEVGAGRRKAGEIMAVLAARNRAAAGPPAPPHGLCLWEVKYPPRYSSRARLR